MKILDSESMKRIDARATSEFGIPSILLMENAAIAVADAIEAHYPDAERVALFCGAGQNGGDGLALARHLANRGVAPHVFLLAPRDSIHGNARTNLEICEKSGIRIDDVLTTDEADDALASATECDLVVDAIFGTGLNRRPEGVFADVIRGLFALRLPIVAVDLPSGLNGSSAEAIEPIVQADLTVTFALPKIPHIFEPAASYCGEVIVADISIPRAAIDIEKVRLSVTTPAEIARLFPRRAADSHKGTFGHAVLICGSEGKSGAAILAARGALRSGAGLVTVVTDPATAAVVDGVSIESMTLPVDMSSDPCGTIAGFVNGKSAALIGPGLPDDESSYEIIRTLVSRLNVPLVIDATAVNAFSQRASEISRRSAPTIITPHPGELARLLGYSTAEVNARRVDIAREAAKVTNAVVVLKGHHTIIATPSGEAAVNPTGNPGMASGGMGDVLAGIAVSFLAQELLPFDAACAATYIHGHAGDLLRDEKTEIGMTAMEVADRVPAAIHAIRGDA